MHTEDTLQPGPNPTATPTTPDASPLPASAPLGPVEAHAAAEAPAKEKIDWGQKVLDNKTAVLVGLFVLLLLGLGGWYWSVAQQQAAAGPGSAVSADQIASMTGPVNPQDAPDPQAALEQTLTEEQNARPVEETSPDALLASGKEDLPPLDDQPTPAQQAAYRRSMATAARANNTDSVLATRRDPSTGQYSQQRVAQQRVTFNRQPSRAPTWTGTAPGASSFTTEAAAAAARPRPTRDTDGTPFETNDEINMMLANLPEGVKSNYEKMSGRRFRPLLGSQQQQGKDVSKGMQYIPGMDGFNTVKFRGSNASADEDLESSLVPDIFYRCTIQGTQVVRTGSVVLLRLAEDATFGGVTFPRNMIFAALASVESNRVTLQIDRLGPHRVAVQVYNYSYMPGIMIDPGKREKPAGGNSMMSSMTQSSTQELSNAIAQSQQAANSWQGIGGRMAVTMLGRMPRSGQKLRDVTLPDGYPILLTRAQSGGAGARSAGNGFQQGGPGTATGIMGQDGNPMQSVLMQGVGQGGYYAQPGYQNLPPGYVQQPGQRGN